MRFLVAMLALWLTPLAAQPQPARPEVHGAVTEPGTHQPVVDATVTVWLRPNPPPVPLLNGGFKDVYLKTKTGNDGAFSFQVERYGVIMVKVEKPGYRAETLPPLTDQATITIDKDHPSRPLALHLSRPGVLTGRVIDEETRKPVAHVKLAAFQAAFSVGRRRFLNWGDAVETDGAGQFAIHNLSPAEYVVVIRPPSADEARVVARFEPADAEAIDYDFERTWWPGGHDQDLAVPVPVAGGQTFDVGQIAVRKAPLYRAKAVFSSAACAPDLRVNLSFVVATADSLSTRGLGSVVCGQPFLLTGLGPGSYTIEAHTDGPFETLERGRLALDIKDKNIEVKSLLARGVDVDLQVTPTEGSPKTDWSKVRVLLRPRGRGSYGNELPRMLDEEGRVHLDNVEVRECDFSLTGLPAGFYVKDLRYNGAAMPLTAVTISGAAMAHKIEIVVDNKPASLTGETVPGSRVILARLPLAANPLLSLIPTLAGEDGRYQFSNLAPGEYRVFAIATEGIRKLNQPGVLDALIQTAAKVTLESGTAKTQNLEPVK